VSVLISSKPIAIINYHRRDESGIRKAGFHPRLVWQRFATALVGNASCSPRSVTGHRRSGSTVCIDAALAGDDRLPYAPFAMVIRRIVLAVCALLVVPSAGLASHRSAGHQIVVHPRFRVVGHDGEATNGAYTIVWNGRRGVVGTLVDERSGQRVLVRLPGYCRAPVDSQPYLGGSWLLVDCTKARMGLYSLAHRWWRSVAVKGPCRGFNPGRCGPVAVGTDWIEYDDERNINLGDKFVFQNVVTGAIRRDPTNARTRADLDSPRLAQRVCAPLRVPSNGTVEFQGRFALAINYQANVFLEECGTRLHVSLGSALDNQAIAPAAVIYGTGLRGVLSGIFLPSLQRFAVTPPAVSGPLIRVDLSISHIYVDATDRRGRYNVWSAPTSALRVPGTS
jgi:hypothetical protein